MPVAGGSMASVIGDLKRDIVFGEYDGKAQAHVRRFSLLRSQTMNNTDDPLSLTC